MNPPCVLPLVPLALGAAIPGGGVDMAHAMSRLIMQLAVILIAARMGGVLCHRFLKVPAVLGELAAGMLFGPYALGGLAIPGWGPMFPMTQGPVPVSPELYGMATLASILLLFLSGLETDLGTFLKYSTAGLMVGIGGVVFSFALGDLCALWFGVADHFMAPAALFLGAIATATSVGLTARILTERRQMGSPEGVTILAGAVLDDVLGIVMLAVVVGMVRMGAGGGGPDWGAIGRQAGKAIGFWLAFTAGGLLAARPVARLLKMSRSMETVATLCLGLALLLSGLSEMAGLAMIIGAYIMGLSLSRTDLVYELRERLHGMYTFMIPIFFCVMGMLVNFAAMKGVLLLGAVYTLLAVVSKVAGCALPAWLMKFTPRGALRVGIGMVPRGEVALIVAGIGLSSGAIGSDIFGVAMMMTIVSTVLAPPLLVKAFEGGSGVRGEMRTAAEEMATIALRFPSESLGEFMANRIADTFRGEGFLVHMLYAETPIYQVRKDDMAFSMTLDGPEILLNMPVKHQLTARLIVLEGLLALQDLLESVKGMQGPGAMGAELLDGMFTGSD